MIERLLSLLKALHQGQGHYYSITILDTPGEGYQAMASVSGAKVISGSQAVSVDDAVASLGSNLTAALIDKQARSYKERSAMTQAIEEIDALLK